MGKEEGTDKHREVGGTSAEEVAVKGEGSASYNGMYGSLDKPLSARGETYIGGGGYINGNRDQGAGENDGEGGGEEEGEGSQK